MKQEVGTFAPDLTIGNFCNSTPGSWNYCGGLLWSRQLSNAKKNAIFGYASNPSTAASPKCLITLEVESFFVKLVSSAACSSLTER